MGWWGQEGGGAEGGEYGGEEGRGRERACLVYVCVRVRARQASPVNGPGRRWESGERGRRGCTDIHALVTHNSQNHLSHTSLITSSHQGGDRELGGSPLATMGGSELGDDGGRGAVVSSVFIKAQSGR